MNQKVLDESGSYFHQWKPVPAVLKLKKGVNALMVKNHGGCGANWFFAYLSDQKDLKISPLPNVTQ